LTEDPFARAFDAHGTTLRVTLVGEATTAPYTVLGWSVPDIAATIRITAVGVVFERFDAMQQDDLGIWLAPSGARIAWFKDPEGNILSISQP